MTDTFWIGGSPCAGKTSLSQSLAKRFDLELYSVDENFPAHSARLVPHRHPKLTAWLQATWDQRWMAPPERLLHTAIDCYQEHFTLIQEDIVRHKVRNRLLVEGTALLPAQVHALGVPSAQAIWIIPSPGFQRTHYARRAFVKNILSECSQPEIAFANWMERDIRFATWVTDQATLLGYTTLLVDGSRPFESNLQILSAHFGLSANRS